jgi:hypothetical protein
MTHQDPPNGGWSYLLGLSALRASIMAGVLFAAGPSNNAFATGGSYVLSGTPPLCHPQCGPSSQPTVDVTGEYVGTSHSDHGGGSPISVTLSQAAAAVTGSLSVTGSPCFSHLSFAGMLAGRSLCGSFTDASTCLNIQGTVDGTALNGTYVIEVGIASCVNDTGLFTLTKTSQPPTPTFTTTSTPTPQPATLSGTIRYTGTRGVVSSSQPLRLALFRSFGEAPIAGAVVTSNGGEYQIEAPNAGTYYLAYFFDINDDGKPLGKPLEFYNNRFTEPGDPVAVPQTDVALDLDDTVIFGEEPKYRMEVQGSASGFIIFGVYNIMTTRELVYERFSVTGQGAEFMLPSAGLSPPLKYLPPELGQTWNDTGDSNGYQVDSTAIVVAVNETVQVTAGTFTGCVQVEATLTYPGGYTPGQTYTTVDRRWFAPGVGPVRLALVKSDGTEEDGELTSYCTPGAATDYFPLATNYSWAFTMVATRRSVDVRVVSATGSCVADCNGDGQVTVDELLTLVNIALGNADVSSCLVGDANHDCHITIDEILTAVNNALNGCSGR